MTPDEPQSLPSGNMCHGACNSNLRARYLRKLAKPLGSMPQSSRNEVLHSVLSIGRATSVRGEGVSLSDALSRANYAEVRPQLQIDEIVEELRANRKLIEDWVLYCEDKRATGGWYLNSEKLEIGELRDSSSSRTFQSLEEAVAAYILAELDFWASLNAA